jgi:CRP-like cAMP-binding protein
MISNISNNEYQVITKEETKVILLDYDRILNNLKQNSAYYQFIQNLLKIISNKIHEKNERIEVLTEKTIRNKLLKYIDVIKPNTYSKIIYLPFTYTELAEYLSVDRSALMRELKNLRDEGIIETKDKKIYLKY